ncbi:MAG: hypothetical protein PHY16_19675 [Methylobacter sp.]|nr:hypothetical protein [Methylobacter sp.]
MYCPQFIRDYASPTHFLGEGKRAEHLYDYAQAANLDWQAIRNDAGITDNPEDSQSTEDSFNKMFWSTFKFANRQLPSARSLLVFFISLGLSPLAG